MALNVTRRDLLKLAGGSALGLIFSPLPYKALDDSAIWTQNWKSIPRLSHGQVSYRYSACTLCPAGCPLKVRCVGGSPVSLAGIAGHPLTHGVLCPVGLAAHHMAFHPLRLHGAFRAGGRGSGAAIQSIDADKAMRQVGSIAAKIRTGNGAGSVAILDGQPGRAASVVFREFINAFPDGVYLVPPSREDLTLSALRRLADSPMPELGFDLENTRTVLSFNAPVLDGWGTPGQFTSAFIRRRESGTKFIQVESRPSRTAMRSDAWLRLRPGTEVPLALGIGHLLIRQDVPPSSVMRAIADFDAYAALTAKYTPELVSEITGLAPEQIVMTAKSIGHGPSIVIAGCDPGGGPMGSEADNAVAGLNVLLGTLKGEGGIVVKNGIPEGRTDSLASVRSLDEVPDHSIRLLIVDAAPSGYELPVSLIRRKLVADSGCVVSLSPHLTPLTAWADVVIPAPAQFETLAETANPPGATTASYSLAPPLLPRRENSTDPLAVLDRIAISAGLPGERVPSTEGAIRRRATAVHGSKRGSVYTPADGSSVRVADITTPEQMFEKLSQGGTWIDDRRPTPGSVKFALTRGIAKTEGKAFVSDSPSPGGLVTVMPFGWRSATATALVSPLLSKVFQESELRSLDAVAYLHPRTASLRGLDDGSKGILRNEQATLTVAIRFDARVLPEVVHVAVGPRRNNSESVDQVCAEGVLALMEVGNDGTWRTTTATLEKG